MKSMSGDMKPHFEEVQAHYDLSDEFFGLFQDPSRTYSCAYFAREDMTLGEAQLAKIDLALDKLDLAPGMTLLDVGCGWGSVMQRAVERYDVNVIGLTLSNNQYRYCKELFATLNTDRTTRVELHGWEEFDEPVDRIISIEAFEAFPKERYGAFFETCHRLLPEGGRLVLQTIMGHPLKRWPDLGIPIVMSDLKFMRFIAKEIFPGGSIPCDEDIIGLSGDAGFSLQHFETLNPHYVRTLETWAKNLEAAHDEAVVATSEEVYQRYMKYLTGCADFFERGISELGQFTLTKG